MFRRYYLMFLIIFAICIIPYVMEDSSAKGFGMDTNLSQVHASFTGKHMGDKAGFSVAIPGDVNGDGYDDFIIGAYMSDDATWDAGTTYLIFGNASGWSMDINLSDADASFTGEAKYDQSGFHISGAGDVNGDGYDDFLIGAKRNDEAHDLAGQVYLILGKASNWSMDTSLSEADASFWGEERNDQTGFVGGVGDVNGDGYDDFMIGSRWNEEGGYDRGQCYLIFGKPSGWSTDTDLSNADASYWGETIFDMAARVAGAGDVNGDGFDDILIGVPDQTKFVVDGGVTYLIFGKATGWSMDTSLSNADASFYGHSEDSGSGRTAVGVGDINGDGYDDFVIDDILNDEFGLDSGQAFLFFGNATGWHQGMNLTDADASFHGEYELEYAGLKMGGAGDCNGDGYDDFLISANWVGAGKTYLILGGKDGWSLGTNLSSVHASFVGEADDDSAGIQLAGGGDFNADGYADFLIGAFWNDEVATDAGQVYVVLYDVLPPVVDEDLSKAFATTGDKYSVIINVTDNCGVHNASLEYWYEGSRTHLNMSMRQIMGDQAIGTWQRDITPPWDSTFNLHYIVHVIDKAGYVTSANETSVEVRDNDKPSVSDDLQKDSGTTGDDFLFKVTARDNIMVTAVYVEFGPDLGRPLDNLSMTPGPDDNWTVSIILPSESLYIYYSFYALDDAGNGLRTRIWDMVVRDNDPPILVTDLTKDSCVALDTLFFSASVIDNIGVTEVFVEYWYGEGHRTRESLGYVEGDQWGLVLLVEATPLDLNYRLGYGDAAGNVVMSSDRSVDVVDITEPELISDDTPATATTGEPLEFLVIASDDIGLDHVMLNYTVIEGEDISVRMNLDADLGDGNVRFNHTIILPPETDGIITYTLLVVDRDSNTFMDEQRFVTVIDNDRPIIVYANQVKEAVKGMSLELSVEATDNVAIDTLHLVLMYGTGSWENLTITYSDGYTVEIEVPRRVDGDMRFRFSAGDAAGNWMSTGLFTISLVNLPPTVDDLPTWTVTEDHDASFDLEPFLSDMNDAINDLMVQCDDKEITVEGFVLWTRYDAPVPDRTIDLTVSDGEDGTSLKLVLHVESVNDPPVITRLLPANGTKFKEGKKVTLSVTASDEEGDELTVTWWDGDVELGTDSHLEVKLKPGQHVITVVGRVRDQEAARERFFG